MEKEKKVKKVTIRMTENDYQKYLVMFHKSGIYSQSQFIRDSIFNTVPPKIVKKANPTICERERVRQLGGLANNINQIARNLNILMKKTRREGELVYYLKQLDAIAIYCKSALYQEEK